MITSITLLVSAPLSAEPRPCTLPFSDGEHIADLSDETIDESSGLADSWLSSNRLWTHNDSGDQPRLWALDKLGQVTTVVHLDGADNIDWEDMAIAPCSADDPSPCIYMADFGDNNSVRDFVTIYRFPEPDLGDEPPASITIDDFETLHYAYDTGPRDAETLLVHPTDRRLWVIEKTGEPEVAIFEIPEDFDHPEPHVVSSVATVTIPGALALTRMVTGGDIAPDASELSFRTYTQVYTFCIDDPDDVAAAFAGEPVTTTVLPATIQGEALTYDRGDHSLWLTSEMIPAPLIQLRRSEAEAPDPDPEPEPEPEPSPPDTAEPPPSEDAGQDRRDASQSHRPGNDPSPGTSGCSCSQTPDGSSGFFFVALLLLCLCRSR